ncbi:anhydro-N-acetylmuramic acid kinase [Candidatus Chlorohelix sp.]|uniref:anhydro-N-acetylmuramic acid kinase n=1 Tax=Candidatus Chlorohelix sp. TaxID=3139201 RepID=UPI0030280A70
MELNARVIGLMSGTSVDGIDAALVEFHENETGELGFKVLGHYEHSLEASLRKLTLDACASKTTTQELCMLNFALGEAFAEAVNNLLEKLGMKASEVDLIASHGQTVWHQVEPNRPLSTLQIAEPAVIAARTGITTSSNFRVADVAANGQGAPLASFFDYVFFSDKHKTRALQNIGGIGNVTFLPAGGGHKSATAFDTGPGNVLIDFAAAYYSSGTLSYDIDGQIGASGKIDYEWLEKLLAHPFYAMQPPKSTGRELFSESYWLQLKEEATERNLSGADVIATLTALTAHSIALSVQRFAPEGGLAELIVSGGGGRNPFLMRLLDESLGGKVAVRLHDEFGLPAKQKEAAFFALFGYELLRGRPANLPACTGATHPVILGQLTPGQNFSALLARFAVTMLPTPSAPLQHLYLLPLQ